MSAKIEDLDVVRLKDGRTGTVVHIYETRPNILCVEMDHSNELIDIPTDQVEETIWHS